MNYKKKIEPIEPLSEFAKLLGEELDRYDLQGRSANSVEYLSISREKN